MVYREQILCAYCDGTETSQCPRCGCRLCAQHQPKTEEQWCWACVKEVRDERELTLFKATVHTPTAQRYDGMVETIELWAEISKWIALVRSRRTHKKVVARSREEIEAWRQEAGIRTRW